MSETVLVTGGAGFIGSFVVDALVQRGDHVIVYDLIEPQVHRDGVTPAYVNPEAEFIHGDVRDRHRLEAAVGRADVVSHQAALVGVGQSMYQVERYLDVNTRGTGVLFDILVNSRHHVRKVVIPGSMSAYGEGRYHCPLDGQVAPPLRSEDQMQRQVWELCCPTCGSSLRPMPTDEAKPLQANSVYAITKQTQEQLALSVGTTFDIPTVVLRYFNVFGPRQSLDNPYTGVAAIFMSRLKNDRPPMIFEDGLQTRDFISVHDIVSANLAVMNDDRADYQVFNVGAGIQVSIIAIAQILARLLEKDIEPTITGKFRKGDIRHCSADIARISQTLDWNPQVSLEAGMRELIAWSETIPAEDRVDEATEELRRHGLLLG
jgi:dTDP-L-rhamnose 4-epimerase